jgi:biopolymer transport protein ExbB
MHGLIAGFEFILRGGFMMYPLLFSALVALTVIFERLYLLQKRYACPPDLVPKVLEQVSAGKVSEALALVRDQVNPIASVLATGLSHFGGPIDHMELAMKNQAEMWVPLLEKRVDIIDTVITAAPLMGLLGTITGMMGSFHVLSEKGVNEPNAITGGVAEALIATATGLVIALVCLLAYNFLSTRIKNFVYAVESAASRLTETRMVTQKK